MDCVGQGICCRHAEALSSGSWHRLDHTGLDRDRQATCVFHDHRPHKPYRQDKDNLRQQQFEDKSHDSANDWEQRRQSKWIFCRCKRWLVFSQRPYRHNRGRFRDIQDCTKHDWLVFRRCGRWKKPAFRTVLHNVQTDFDRNRTNVGKKRKHSARVKRFCHLHRQIWCFDRH